MDINREKNELNSKDDAKDLKEARAEMHKINNSILKNFRSKIYGKFAKALADYNMIQEGDRIAVCISGGKDSFLLAKCLQIYQKYSDIKYELEFFNMDPGYPKEVDAEIRRLAELLSIDIKVFESDVFEIANKQKRGKCYLCSRMRRGFLYECAEKLNCNKIALGHHFDDVIETILMNVLVGGQYKTMMPKLKSDNFDGMELIRPLYLVEEEDIIAWSNFLDIKFLKPACPINEEGEEDSKRAEIKNLIKQLTILNPNVKKSIFRSAQNIHLGAVIEFKKNGNRYNFLDFYDSNFEIKETNKHNLTLRETRRGEIIKKER